MSHDIHPRFSSKQCQLDLENRCIISQEVTQFIDYAQRSMCKNIEKGTSVRYTTCDDNSMPPVLHTNGNASYKNTEMYALSVAKISRSECLWLHGRKVIWQWYDTCKWFCECYRDFWASSENPVIMYSSGPRFLVWLATANTLSHLHPFQVRQLVASLHMGPNEAVTW